MSKYDGSERRRADPSAIDLLVEGVDEVKDLCRDIDIKVAIQNGRVSKNEGMIKSLFTKLRSVQDYDLEERSIDKGKRIMKTSTRNTLLIITAIIGMSVGLYKLGVGEIRHNKSQQLQTIIDVLNHKEPVAEGNMRERLIELLENNP